MPVSQNIDNNVSFLASVGEVFSLSNIELIMTVTGILTLAAIIIFTFITSIKDFYYLIFHPLKYIEKNHNYLLTQVISTQFGDNIQTTIDQSILETLRDTGVDRGLDNQKSVLLILTKQYTESSIKQNIKDYRLRLLNIIKNNSKKVKSKIGIKSPTNYEYYINLRNILPNSEEASTASYILAGFIYEYIEKNKIGYDFVAVNRNTNTILGYLISNFLKLPLVIVNYDTRWNINGKNIEIDGLSTLPRPQNKRGFLIDDAVSGGSILKDSCLILRNNKLLIDDVFVLFSRREDNATEDFKQDKINLHSIFELNDKQIEKIIATPNEELERLENEL